MKRSLSFVGCGLLVVALGSVGCSKSKSSGTDAGVDASTSAGGKGGSGGAKAGTGGGKAGSGGAGGTLSAADCTSMTVKVGATMSCASCVCTKNTAAAVACLNDPMKMCWPLIACVGTSGCGSSDIACISGKCASNLGGGTLATAVMIPTMCSAECKSTPTGSDGGAKTDAGN